MENRVVERRGGMSIMVALARLINIASEHGHTAMDVMHQFNEAGHHIIRTAYEMGHQVQLAFLNEVQRDQALRDFLRHQYDVDEISSIEAHSDHDVDMGGNDMSFTNSHGGSEAGVMNEAGASRSEGIEQQVTKPRHIWRRWPNTETAALKWVFTNIFNSTSVAPRQIPFDQSSNVANAAIVGNNVTSTTAATPGDIQASRAWDTRNPMLFQLRMTSPYNILKTYANPSVGVGNSQPNWLRYFDSKYTYYHTLECEWDVSFVINTGSFNQYFMYYIFWRYTSQDDPPTTFNTSGALPGDTSGHTIAGSIIGNQGGLTTPTTCALTPDDYFRMGGWHHKHVTLHNTHLTPVHIRGKYRYGQCKMDIKTIMPSDAHGLDSSAEGWSAVGSTPGFPENLSIIVVADNRVLQDSAAGVGQVNVGVRMETEHVVQFKDLTSAYKFPTPTQTYGTNDDTQFFWRAGGYT